MKKTMIALVVAIFFVAFSSEVSAQSNSISIIDTFSSPSTDFVDVNKKTSFENISSKTSKSSCIFVGVGVQECFMLNENGSGVSFAVSFGANWGKKIALGFEAQVEDRGISSQIRFSNGKENFLKNLSNAKIGPTFVINIKKLSLSTHLSVGWLTGKVDQYNKEDKRIKSEIDLVTLGLSEKISYSFLGWKNFSICSFIKIGVEGMRDDILLRPNKKISYVAIATFGLELSMFPKKLK